MEIRVLESTSNSAKDAVNSSKTPVELPMLERATDAHQKGVKSMNCLAAGLCVPEELKGYECYFNWIAPDFDKKEAGYYLILLKNIINKELSSSLGRINKLAPQSQLEDEFSDTSDTAECLRDSQKEIEDHDTGEDLLLVYRFCHVAFLYSYLGRYKEGQFYLSAAQKCVKAHKMDEDEEFNEEFVNGFDYLCDGFSAFWKAINEDISFQDGVKPLITFRGLHLKAQVTILKFKLSFQSRRKHFKSRLQVYKQLTKLEPEVADWNYWTYFYLRAARRHESDRSGPSEEETAAITAAQMLKPNAPKIKLSGCINLGETLKKMSYFELHSKDFSINYGGKCFNSSLSLIDYMKELARSLLELPDEEVKVGTWYCDLAELFSTGLPAKFYDFDIANKCITKAVRLFPDRTKIHHRMATFQLKAFQNFQLAEKHLKLAMEMNSWNYFAFVDYVQLLMAKPIENESSINRFFQVNLTKTHIWSQHEIARFHFVKGCFLMMLKRPMNDVIKCWLNAFKIRPNADYFKTLPLTMHRFHWPKYSINLAAVRGILLIAVKDTLLKEEEIKLLKDRLEDVELELKLNDRSWRRPHCNVDNSRHQYNSHQNRCNASESSWRARNSSSKQYKHPQRYFTSNSDPMEENWRVSK